MEQCADDYPRTVLYYLLTPLFVLFCNVVATSDPNDFDTLERVTGELEGLVEPSTSIARLQTLFKSFIELCESCLGKATENHPFRRRGWLSGTSSTAYMPLATSQALSYTPSLGMPASQKISTAFV